MLINFSNGVVRIFYLLFYQIENQTFLFGSVLDKGYSTQHHCKVSYNIALNHCVLP